MRKKKKNLCKIIQRISLFFLLLLITQTQLFAQKRVKKDELTAMREFVQVCNSYKKMPLHLKVVINRSADFPRSAEDTASSAAEFFITKKGTYVKMDELEQLANDSLMLFISNNAKRMVLYPNNTPVATQFDNYIGIQLRDSSLQKIATKYTVSLITPSEENKQSQIELQSKNKIVNTTLSKETIQLKYNSDSKQILEVQQVFRRLIPLDSAEYNTLLSQSDYADKLIATDEHGFFLINKHTTDFIYKTVESSDNIVLPMQLNSCITKNSTGQYATAKGYEGFELTENF